MRARRPFILILLAFLFSMAMAAGLSAAAKGNETKGKFYFKQNCKSCHTKGATGGELTPLNKKMSQWTTYFNTGKHNHGKEPLTQYVSAEQLRDVQTFLTNHAAESLQPETCGKD